MDEWLKDDHLAIERARMLDGKLLLVTNMPDHTPEEIVSRYKSLADIERGLWEVKSEIEIDPMFHRLPNRICAHAMMNRPGIVPRPADAPQGQEQPLFPKPDAGSGARYPTSPGHTPSQTISQGAHHPDP